MRYNDNKLTNFTHFSHILSLHSNGVSMEPPAKRTKVGRAPHDAPIDDNVNNGNKMNGNKGKKSSNGGASTTSKAKNGDDEDDEIAMDPEDYAMKVDPEYRLDRNRANADNKLKSAFELLFEKYSQDFGDTGDEINFYTDEIEVDNGHIASLPVERPSRQGDQGSDEDGDEDGGGEADKLPAMSAAAKAASSRLVASLLPSRFGPGGTVFMGGGAPTAQGSLAPGEIDPTWAAPELPDTAFTTPGGGFPFIPPPPPPPPRAAYAAPQPAVFTKALPTSYAGDLGEDGDNEEDDLLMDAPNSATKENSGENNPPSSVPPKPAEAQPTRKRRKKQSVVPGPQSSGLALSEVQSSAPLPASFDEEIPQDGPSSPPAQGSLPTPPDGDDDSGGAKLASKESAKPKETFKRNTVDPSFVFSDEEDLGLKKKKKRPQPVSDVPAVAASEPQEAAPAILENAVQTAPVLEEETLPLEAPVVENKEQKRRGRPRRSGGAAELVTAPDIASEVTESYDLPEAQRREAQSLSIIIMTSSRPSSSLSTPAVTTTEVEVETATQVAATIAVPIEAEPISELESEPVPMPEPGLETEPEPVPTATPAVEPVAEPTPEPASEPEDEPIVEPEIERDVEMDDSTYAPSPPKEVSEDRPKKRKRRRQTEEDGPSSPIPSSQKSVKSTKSLKWSQKSASSSTKSKAGRRRHTREIPDSQSIGSSGIISLVSDGEADEAEVEKIAEASPRPFVPGSGGRQPVSASSVNVSRRGSPQTTPTSRSRNRDQTTPSSRRRLTAAEALMATPSRHRSHNKAGRLTPTASRLLLLSPLARRHQQMSGTSSAASSPGGSPVQTPGGTMRRCGRDGFRCEREFCFRCT